ncbi:hypothetical protein FEM54_13640 [Pseudomonas edaphica]|uniref:Uncharacterized protein n=1 Tax=Pseudomonas edaphica TaxID=2006980 RepID=A0ABY2UA44_9PSED|nr:hypothetical protein [Pseudomonas edaphica]TLG91339.1 hypothetical protein FEM54_13640 [Pseudomonas edaphica]
MLGLVFSDWVHTMTRSLAMAISILLISGCMPPVAERLEAPGSVVERAPAATPVIRSGRYTLIEIRPEPTQQALLEQVIDITLPSGWNLTVGDALRYVLRVSGFRLGDQCPQSAVLYELPLPAAHHRLGPIRLQDGLKTLIGPAWTVQADHGKRRICFAPVADIPLGRLS